VTVRPGVLLNANARRARRDPRLIDRLKRLVPAERVDELRTALATLLDREPDALVLVGGDGTQAHTLTALLRHFDPASLPPIVPTRGGTVNTVARSLGARGTPEDTLAALLADDHPHEERRAVLRVAADGGEPCFGFLFVNGVGVRFLERYYDHSPRGAVGALSVVGQISTSALLGGALARSVFAPFAAELCVDGGEPMARRFSIVAAGAVRHIGLGFAPFYTAGSDPERIHLATSSASAARLALELPALRAGARGGCIEHHPCRRAELEMSEPLAWSLDAELFPPARRLEIAAGPALRFLRPHARRP